MDTPHQNNHSYRNAESLSAIIARAQKRFEENTPHTNQEEPSDDKQENLLPAVPTDTLPVAPEYVRSEKFLETCGFFTPSSKRLENIYTKEKKVHEYTDKHGVKHILKTKIKAIHDLGLPITSDQDYYRAFLKICSEAATFDRHGRAVFQLPIPTPTTKLIRYAGKRESAKEWQEVRNWLQRMTFTGIEGAIYRKKKRNYDEGIYATVFSQVVVKGETMKNGKPADTNYVWPAPWFLSNYHYHHSYTLDFAFYKQLRKPIAKAFYTLLENGWYASEARPYSKSYRALCGEFLMQQFAHLSRIKQQLDPSHTELQKLGLLESWTYHKTTKGDDYIITWYAGQKFFHDQQAKDARHERAAQIGTSNGHAPQIENGTQEPPQPAPPQLALMDKRQLLLADVLATCGDSHNEPWYKKVIATYSEPLIRDALSETHQAHLEGRILKTKGAYFTDTLKRLVQYHEQRGIA